MKHNGGVFMEYSTIQNIYGILITILL